MLHTISRCSEPETLQLSLLYTPLESSIMALVNTSRRRTLYLFLLLGRSDLFHGNLDLGTKSPEWMDARAPAPLSVHNHR
ncbi:hypothetical protein CC2G_009500 [Coprinopsis cinerea AmutBmut pab1-1]|nr:hypothetical protein CC2G_004871 [Coprinopsis cinerea AmutBmut pab1-1]KAG2016324.1 hypothetical protein CC2G_009500 [Coprinopsis cinerea AmutBmut pab1-1]